MGQSLQSEYAKKLTTAERAAEMIPSGAKVVLPVGAGLPPAILAALANRAKAGCVDQVSFYYLLGTGIAGQTVFDRSLIGRMIPKSYFHGGVERTLDKALKADGVPAIEVMPCHFSQVPRSMIEHVGVDTLVAMVSPMDEMGRFSLSTSADYSAAVAKKPDLRIILQVNRQMPYVAGDCLIPLSDVTALVEEDAALPLLPSAQRSPTDDKIGAIIAGLVRDGDCLQMGIGALPDAVCAGLINHKHLGIHTEMMTPGLARLVTFGVVDNSRKQINIGRSIYTFALGDQELYDFLSDNPDIEAHPVSYTNDPAVICRNDNVVSVNATFQIDLGGACNSEFMGGRQYSGTGGQLDFVRGAYASAGGRSIIACHSTAAGGKISRITAKLDGPTTTPRNETHLVVTEFGYVDLKGKSVSGRAKALISIAHPDFQDELARDAHAMGLRVG